METEKWYKLQIWIRKILSKVICHDYYYLFNFTCFDHLCVHLSYLRVINLLQYNHSIV